MQESNFRLIDEALAVEPIKNTFRLGWEFIILNRRLTITIISTLIVLAFLGLLPIVGFVFGLFSSVLSQSMQIYLGRLVYSSENIGEFVSDIEQVDGEVIVKRHFAVAMGSYVGWIAVAFLLLMFFGVLAGTMGLDESILNNEKELIAFLTTMASPLIVTMLFLFYLQPLVQANVMMSNSFNEAFSAVFTLFSVRLWKMAFQRNYFRYISLFGLILLVMAFLFAMVVSVGMSIPVLNILIMVVPLYVISIIFSVSSMMARRLVE